MLANSNALQNSTVTIGGTPPVFDSAVPGHAYTLGGLTGSQDLTLADNAGNPLALTVGKNLSPRLHVSYGVALFGPGQVVTFKYLLSRVLNIQIDSGSESRAALNYRLER